jgi:hypothetical protein
MTDGHGVLLGRKRPARPGARDSASASRRGPSKGDLKERTILATCEPLLGEKPLHEIGVDELRGFWEDIVRRFVEQSAARIGDERAAGAAPPGPDPEALAKALIWMNERCFYTNSLGTEPSLSDDELVPTLTAVWLRSIFASFTPPAGA